MVKDMYRFPAVIILPLFGVACIAVCNVNLRHTSQTFNEPAAMPCAYSELPPSVNSTNYIAYVCQLRDDLRVANAHHMTPYARNSVVTSYNVIASQMNPVILSNNDLPNQLK